MRNTQHKQRAKHSRNVYVYISLVFFFLNIQTEQPIRIVHIYIEYLFDVQQINSLRHAEFRRHLNENSTVFKQTCSILYACSCVVRVCVHFVYTLHLTRIASVRARRLLFIINQPQWHHYTLNEFILLSVFSCTLLNVLCSVIE